MHLLRSAFESAVNFAMRLPELFCGFPRVQGAPPIAYPVACSPQAWAAAALFSLLQSCLGLRIDAVRGKVSLHAPRLPPFIDWVRVQRLQVGDANVDLLMQRYAHNVGVEALRKEGTLEVAVVM